MAAPVSAAEVNHVVQMIHGEMDRRAALPVGDKGRMSNSDDNKLSITKKIPHLMRGTLTYPLEDRSGVPIFPGRPISSNDDLKQLEEESKKYVWPGKNSTKPDGVPRDKSNGWAARHILMWWHRAVEHQRELAAMEESEEAESEAKEQEAEAEEQQGEEQEEEGDANSDESDDDSKAEGAGVACTLAITAEPNGVYCDQCGARGLWGTDPCPHCGDPGTDDESDKESDDTADAAVGEKRPSCDALLAACKSYTNRNVTAKYAAVKKAVMELEVARNKVDEEAAAEASKSALLKVREKITSNTWEVAAHTRTNLEQQTCTVPLLDRLIEMEAWKTHDVKDEVEIPAGGKGKVLVRIDIVLIAKDPSTHCDIRIECKAKDHMKARGQCRYYQELELRPEAETKVYSYFPKEPEPHVLNGFERDETGVLWPGQEHTIQFVRSVA
jgi:hypothetical protein